MYRNMAFGRGVDSLDIMLVDENRGMQRILAAVLAANRVRRLRAHTSADAALDDMVAAPPDILLIDWNLVESDAETLIRTMRMGVMSPLCFVPVIVLASQVSRGVIRAVLAAGASSLLKKPVTTSALVARIVWATRDERPFRLEGDSYVLPAPQTPAAVEGRTGIIAV